MDMRHQFRPAAGRVSAPMRAGASRLPPPRLIAGLGLIGLAGGLATLAAMAANQWLDAEAGRRAGRLAVPPPQADVWVAKSALSAGTTFDPARVRRASWPAAAVPRTAIAADPARLRALAGRRLSVDVPEGSLLLDGHFLASGAAGALSFRVAEGMRAVTVPVTASSGLAGLVQPGDRVDLLFSGTLADGRRISDTAFADVKVLGLDQRLDPQGDDPASKDAVPDTVTLEVTPEAAEAIALLAEAGRLSLALRAHGGPDTATDLAGAYAAPAGAAALLARLATAVRAADPLGVSPAAAPSAQVSAPPPPDLMAPSAEGTAKSREGGVVVVRGSSIRGQSAAATVSAGDTP